MDSGAYEPHNLIDTINDAQHLIGTWSVDLKRDLCVSAERLNTLTSLWYMNAGLIAPKSLKSDFARLGKLMCDISCPDCSLSQMQQSVASCCTTVEKLKRDIATFEDTCKKYETLQKSADVLYFDLTKFLKSPRLDAKLFSAEVSSLEQVKQRCMKTTEAVSELNERLQAEESENQELVPTCDELNAIKNEIAQLQEQKRYLEDQIDSYCNLSLDSKNAQAQLESAMAKMELMDKQFLDTIGLDGWR